MAGKPDPDGPGGDKVAAGWFTYKKMCIQDCQESGKTSWTNGAAKVFNHDGKCLTICPAASNESPGKDGTAGNEDDVVARFGHPEVSYIIYITSHMTINRPVSAS